MHVQRSELDRLTQALEAERRRAVEREEKAQLSNRDVQMHSDKQELEMLRWDSGLQLTLSSFQFSNSLADSKWWSALKFILAI